MIWDSYEIAHQGELTPVCRSLSVHANNCGSRKQGWQLVINITLSSRQKACPPKGSNCKRKLESEFTRYRLFTRAANITPVVGPGRTG